MNNMPIPADIINPTKKYELTGETRDYRKLAVVHRIRALKDFTLHDGTPVKAGELGGWIENERNLSQGRNAWVKDDAVVYGKAQVFDSAVASGNAEVYGTAGIQEFATVSGFSIVGGCATVCGSAKVTGNARVMDGAKVGGNALVDEMSEICGSAIVCGNAHIGGYALIRSSAKVYDKAVVYGDTTIDVSVTIGGSAKIQDEHDYIVIKSWMDYSWIMFTRSDRMWSWGRFRGTGEELVKIASKDTAETLACVKAIVGIEDSLVKAQDAYASAYKE